MAHVRVKTIGETTYAYLSENKILELELVEEISGELESIVEKAATRRVDIDLQTVQFMSSAMIGAFVAFVLKCRNVGVDVRFQNVTSNVRKILQITRLDRVLPIARPGEGHSTIRFSPELFEDRNRVLEALEEAGFAWLGDFTAVEPLHDVYGIEVRGIRHGDDANRIQELLEHLYPDWRPG